MNDQKTTIAEIKTKLETFTAQRDWLQFHTPKDLAIAVSVEAAEILEHFRFRNGKDLDLRIMNHKKEISYEIADVLSFLIRLSDELGIDMTKALEEKMALNKKRYPIATAKGRNWMDIKK